ncbi:hypothetical protein CDCA_CDCA01G0099 [Cyanidium caldarium]|uniref:Uncharacterized protein n=1 Tax=Cyanidium caldarium TaxID=2771 RepID=A0AAV9IP18_CYACA|nr:hypothetical protein CDCA_CDCA01G0099 [Cyanidium caldarium]
MRTREEVLTGERRRRVALTVTLAVVGVTRVVMAFVGSVTARAQHAHGLRRHSSSISSPARSSRRHSCKLVRSTFSSSLPARRLRRGFFASWRLSSTEPLTLSEENVERVLEEARGTLSTIFGSEENRAVGITGKAALAGLEGPTVVLRLEGRFWHRRADVLARLQKFIQDRIPECVDVTVEDPKMLDDK